MVAEFLFFVIPRLVTVGTWLGSTQNYTEVFSLKKKKNLAHLLYHNPFHR